MNPLNVPLFAIKKPSGITTEFKAITIWYTFNLLGVKFILGLSDKFTPEYDSLYSMVKGRSIYEVWLNNTLLFNSDQIPEGAVGTQQELDWFIEILNESLTKSIFHNL